MWFVVWLVAVCLLCVTGRNYGRVLYAGLGQRQRRWQPAAFAWWRRARLRLAAVAGGDAGAPTKPSPAGDELLEVASVESATLEKQTQAEVAAALDVASALRQQPMDDLSVMGFIGHRTIAIQPT